MAIAFSDEFHEPDAIGVFKRFFDPFSAFFRQRSAFQRPLGWGLGLVVDAPPAFAVGPLRFGEKHDAGTEVVVVQGNGFQQQVERSFQALVRQAHIPDEGSQDRAVLLFDVRIVVLRPGHDRLRRALGQWPFSWAKMTALMNS